MNYLLYEAVYMYWGHMITFSNSAEDKIPYSSTSFLWICELLQNCYCSSSLSKKLELGTVPIPTFQDLAESYRMRGADKGPELMGFNGGGLIRYSGTSHCVGGS